LEYVVFWGSHHIKVRLFMKMSDRLLPLRRAPLITALIGLLLSWQPIAMAFDVGHARVASAPGAPLVLTVPVNGLSQADSASLKAAIAPAQQWSELGLRPPVALESLQLSIEQGLSASQRVVRVSSGQVSDQSVIDLLITVSTDSANRQVQASVIVPPPPSVRLASDQSTTVMRGDTLIGIANRYPVAGANLYQMLWALYQANPNAFIDQNMNLLKAGAALSIPDAATVRGIDPAMARERYLSHLQAFQARRAGIRGNVPAADGAAPPLALGQQGAVEQSSPQPAEKPTQDQVRLSTAPTSPSAFAEQDRQTSEAKAAADEKARLEALNQNIDSLKSALGVTGDAGGSSATAVTAGSSSNAAAASAQSATGAASEVNATSNTTGTAGAAGSDAGSAAGSATAASTQSATGAASEVNATSNTTGTAGAAGSDAGSAAGSATAASTQSANGAASEAVADQSNVQPATQAPTEATTEVTTQTDARPGLTSSSATDSTTPLASTLAQAVSEDALTRFKHWVTQNLLASVAIVLALLALILAWVLRKSAVRDEEKDKPADVSPDVSPQAAAFEQKLQAIDLSLDDKSPQVTGNKDTKV
jgi:pilus assembly protein FimV